VNGTVAVAAHHFGSGFGAVMSALLKQQTRSGQAAVEFLIGLQDDACRGLLELLQRAPPPAAVIGISVRPAPEVVAAFRAKAIPVVLIDEEAEGASTVGSDNLAGGLLAGQLLARLGRKRPAVVCGRRSVRGGQNAVLRVRGFERGLAGSGLTLAAENIVEVAEYSRKDGVTAMTEILARRPAIDAVFCAAGDLCATGMLSVARERRVPVPEQIALIGFDDHPMSGICQPPMTTIRQPLDRIAADAYRLATDEAAAAHARPQRLLFAPELVQRVSA
jgi:DNA-binding LacI/PurR family transcriptional regulator